MSIFSSVRNLFGSLPPESERYYSIIDVSSCSKRTREESAASESFWAQIPTADGRCREGLIKHDYKQGDFIREKFVYELSKLTPSLKCTEYDIGIDKGKMCCISYKFHNDSETFEDGKSILKKGEELYEKYKNKEISIEQYEIERVLNSLEHLDKDNCFGLKSNFLKMVLFDCLIKNTDRRPKNWGVIHNKKTGGYRFVPPFDHGYSLNPFSADDSIRVGESDLKYTSVVDFIASKYYNETKDFVKEIEQNVNIGSTNKIFDRFSPRAVRGAQKVFQMLEEELPLDIMGRRDYIVDRYKEKKNNRQQNTYPGLNEKYLVVARKPGNPGLSSKVNRSIQRSKSNLINLNRGDERTK